MSTRDNALNGDVVHPVLCLAIGGLDGSSMRLEVDVERGVIRGWWTHCIVSDATKHAAVISADVDQIQYTALWSNMNIKQVVSILFGNNLLLIDAIY